MVPLRFDFIFSYWILLWFLFYYFNYTEYCPNSWLILGIINNFMTIYSSSSRTPTIIENINNAKTAALTLNLKVNTLIVWMNYLSSKNRNALVNLSSDLNKYNQDPIVINNPSSIDFKTIVFLKDTGGNINENKAGELHSKFNSLYF
jgi:hypothetical protein